MLAAVGPDGVTVTPRLMELFQKGSAPRQACTLWVMRPVDGTERAVQELWDSGHPYPQGDRIVLLRPRWASLLAAMRAGMLNWNCLLPSQPLQLAGAQLWVTRAGAGVTLTHGQGDMITQLGFPQAGWEAATAGAAKGAFDFSVRPEELGIVPRLHPAGP